MKKKTKHFSYSKEQEIIRKNKGFFFGELKTGTAERKINIFFN